MYSKTITFFALAATAFAAPQLFGASATTASDNDLSVSDAMQMCGNGQAISCCNTESNGDNGGLLGGLLGGILGGSCSQLTVPGTSMNP